ncbi:uncharacterized protein METZ01_LOCUS154604, partial [marine metagenome]
AHGIDIGKSVGNGYASEVVGVIDQRSDEIKRDDESVAIAQSIHGGVVACGDIHKRFGSLYGDQMAQNLRQLGDSELTSSPGAVRQLSQADS